MKPVLLLRTDDLPQICLFPQDSLLLKRLINVKFDLPKQSILSLHFNSCWKDAPVSSWRLVWNVKDVKTLNFAVIVWRRRIDLKRCIYLIIGIYWSSKLLRQREIFPPVRRSFSLNQSCSVGFIFFTQQPGSCSHIIEQQKCVMQIVMVSSDSLILVFNLKHFCNMGVKRSSQTWFKMRHAWNQRIGLSN